MSRKKPHWDQSDFRHWEETSVQVTMQVGKRRIPIHRLPNHDGLIGFGEGGIVIRQVGEEIHQYRTGFHALDRAIRHGLAHYRREVPELQQVWNLVGGENVDQIDLVTFNAFDLWAVHSRLRFAEALRRLTAIQVRRHRKPVTEDDPLQRAINQLEIVSKTPFDRLKRVNSGMVQARSAAVLRAILQRILQDNGASAGLTHQLLLVMQLLQETELALERGAEAMMELHKQALTFNGGSRRPHYWFYRACEQSKAGVPPYDRVIARVVNELTCIGDLIEDDNGHPGNPRYRGRDITVEQWHDVANLSWRAYNAFELARLRGPFERLLWYLGDDGQAEFPKQGTDRAAVMLLDLTQGRNRLKAVDDTGFSRQTKKALVGVLDETQDRLAASKFGQAKEILSQAFDPKNPLI